MARNTKDLFDSFDDVDHDDIDINDDRVFTPDEEPETDHVSVMNDILHMVKDITTKGYNWEHPLIVRWQYETEPYVFELTVVNDKSQLVFDPHVHGTH